MKTAGNIEAGSFPFQLDEFYLDLQEDGSKVSMLSQEEIAARPFPGLRPFKTSEFQLFNGRVGQAEELIKRLKKNRFLAVIGSSGTGKSSLVRAGLIPQLFGGYLHGAGSKWNIAICRPGRDPIENLAIALAGIKTPGKQSEELINNFNEIEPHLSNSIYGLLDVKEMLDASADANSEKSPSNLLIIIDQFEELFRFERTDLGKDNIESQFVNLLLKASLDPANAVYVIITMRSEFLGDCVKYRGLPEAINEGQYLVPQLTRNELKEVIEKPIRLAGKKIDASLVELLVNEIEESKLKENLDQLPILQHALMRTYNEAMRHGPNTEISYEHYKKIGEMDMALADHAEALFSELGDAGSNGKQLSQKQQLAKMIFQALTELSSGQKGGRRPTELKNIYAIAASMNISEKEVDEVVNHFRDNDTSFIMPPINTALYPNLIIDISHESLMRNWASLTGWMTEEMKYGNLYKQMNERRERYEYDKEERLRGILLRELLDWKKSYANNVTWATRYHELPKKMNDPALHESIYKKNIDFLDESESISERIRAEERMELLKNIEREQKVKAARKRVRVLSFAAGISLLFGLWAFAERNNANDQKKVADLKTAEAISEKKRADLNAKEAKRNADSTVALRTRIANEQRMDAEQQIVMAYEQNRKLQQYNDKVRIQKEIALRLNDSLESKNSAYEKQFVKSALKSEPFYFSTSLDPVTKEEIIDQLFNTPLLDAGQISLGKYVDLNVLKLINEAVKAKENVTEDPEGSLRTVRRIWKTNQHPILKKLLLGMVNDNIFPGSAEQPVNNIDLDNTNLAVSKNNSGFAFNNQNQVVTGRYNGAKLLINENSFDTTSNHFFCNLRDSLYAHKNIGWLDYNDNNSAVALIDSFKIKFASDGKVDGIESMPGIKNYPYSRLSPDGKLALLMDGDGSIFLRSTPQSDQKYDTAVGNYRNKLSGNENMFFSPNSQYIFLNVEGKPRIINRKNVVTGMTDWNNENVATAAFTPDSRLVIVVADGKMAVRDSSLGNKKAGFEEIDLTAGPFTRSSILPDRISSISMSQNWKKLLITQKNGRVYLLENKNGDSLFAKKVTTQDNIRIKEIGSNWSRLKAAFYNDSVIITISNMGKISLWNIYPDFDNADEAFTAVFPKRSFREELENGSISAREILATGNATEMNIAADYYFSQENVDTAKIFWQKLLDNAPPEMRVYYLGKLTDMNTELNSVARINSTITSNKSGFSAIKEYRSLRAKRLKENIIFLREQVSLCPNNMKYKENLSSAYGSLSFNQLFLDDFDGAIRSAKTGLDISPQQNDWINTNLALGNLLSGRYAEAEKIYSYYKDKIFTDRRMSFKTAFSDDFRDLEAGGVFKDLSRDILDDITRIKAMLASPTLPVQSTLRKAKARGE